MSWKIIMVRIEMFDLLLTDFSKFENVRDTCQVKCLNLPDVLKKYSSDLSVKSFQSSSTCINRIIRNSKKKQCFVIKQNTAYKMEKIKQFQNLVCW